MKIEKVIRDAFLRQQELNQRVQEEVNRFGDTLDHRWHYVGRLKSEESFAQKIEAGRFKGDLTIDDFFACTVVVRNSTEIGEATARIEEAFEVVERRPPAADATSTRPTEFLFDDLRLYAKLRPTFHGPRPIENVTFEIQIKTFLLHAWSIATHDLTYKTDEVRWSRLRLAFQIRAMLEHAELAIEQFEELEKSPRIFKKYPEYTEIVAIIGALKDRWEPAALPRDLQRLARAIRQALDKLSVTAEAAFAAVDAETAEGKGAQSLEMSPYSAVLQSVLARCHIDGVAASRRNQRLKIVLSSSVEIPAYLRPSAGAIFRVI